MAVVQPVAGQTIAPQLLLEKDLEVSVQSREVSTPESDDSSSSSDSSSDSSNYLIASPYEDQEHLLDLRTVNAENGFLARALRHMRAVRPDYATAPYAQSFNWSEVVDEVAKLVREEGHRWEETSFFIVAFRSQIRPTTDYVNLGALDKAAHAEATATGGFLKYWFGVPDKDRNNLATCVWRSSRDASNGTKGPAHKAAVLAAGKAYVHHKIDVHRLIIRDGLDSWDLVDWKE